MAFKVQKTKNPGTLMAKGYKAFIQMDIYC